MGSFTIKSSPPIKEVIAHYTKTVKDIRQLTATNAKIATWLDGWVQRNFKTEGGNVGKWAPFKKGGRKKAGMSFDASAKLLQDTSRLRHSYSPFHSKNDAGIGSDVEYAVTHEFGNPTKGLPARRMLPRKTDKDVIDNLKRIYNRDLNRSISNHWDGKF